MHLLGDRPAHIGLYASLFGPPAVILGGGMVVSGELVGLGVVVMLFGVGLVALSLAAGHRVRPSTDPAGPVGQLMASRLTHTLQAEGMSRGLSIGLLAVRLLVLVGAIYLLFVTQNGPN